MNEKALAGVPSVSDVAGNWADEVDRLGRFPVETVAAARDARLLGAAVPQRNGGLGYDLLQLCETCRSVGTRCGSSALILAMHYCMILSIARLPAIPKWHEDFLARVAADQLLVASSTTELKTGGDIHTSQCALVAQDGKLLLEKSASVISYGVEADAILVTSRTGPDASPTDQAITAFLKADYTLVKVNQWNAMGMRGTCSDGFEFSGRSHPDQVLTDTLATASLASMTTASHALWSAVWLGIAGAGLEKAHRALRYSRNVDALVYQRRAVFADALSEYYALRAFLRDILMRLEQGGQVPLVETDALKLQASSAAGTIVEKCAKICGFAGYKEDSPLSISRLSRDITSAQFMISNDRLRANIGAYGSLYWPDLSLEG